MLVRHEEFHWGTIIEIGFSCRGAESGSNIQAGTVGTRFTSCHLRGKTAQADILVCMGQVAG